MSETSNLVARLILYTTQSLTRTEALALGGVWLVLAAGLVIGLHITRPRE